MDKYNIKNLIEDAVGMIFNYYNDSGYIKIISVVHNGNRKFQDILETLENDCMAI